MTISRNYTLRLKELRQYKLTRKHYEFEEKLQIDMRFPNAREQLKTSRFQKAQNCKPFEHTHFMHADLFLRLIYQNAHN